MTNLKYLIPFLIVSTIGIANGLYFPLNLWKNYDLNSQTLCFSHSEQSHNVCMLDRQANQYQAQYLFDGTSMIMKFTSEAEMLTVVSLPEGLVISGLKENEKISLSIDGENISTYKQFKAVQGEVKEGEQL